LEGIAEIFKAGMDGYCGDIQDTAMIIQFSRRQGGNYYLLHGARRYMFGGFIM
jgi:hypothetical protein